MSIDIGIEEGQRKEIAQGLKRLLADSFTLYLKTHNFHWNVTGPMFNTLHVMFMEQYTEMWTAIDDIAERIRSLGEFAPGSFADYLAITSLTETEGVPDANEMLRQLVQGHEAVIRTARSIFPVAEQGGDEATADVLTQRLQVHEKTAWMLRSMLG